MDIRKCISSTVQLKIIYDLVMSLDGAYCWWMPISFVAGVLVFLRTKLHCGRFVLSYRAIKKRPFEQGIKLVN